MTTLADRQPPTNYNWPDNYAILGGVGAGADSIVAPVWIAFYAVSFGLGIWRTVKPSSRHWLLLLVALVAACRIVSNTMRYIEYGSSSGTRKWVVIEQIFINLGYFFLVDAVLLLLAAILAPTSTLMSYPGQARQRKNSAISWILTLCNIALIPAVFLGAYAAGYLRSLRNSSPNLADIGRLRLAGAGLFLGVALILILAALYTKRARPTMKLRSWILLLVITVLTAIPAAYMVAIYRQARPASKRSDGAKAAYYTCFELPIFLTVLLLSGFNLPHEFGFRQGAPELSDDSTKPARSGEQWAELESTRV